MNNESKSWKFPNHLSKFLPDGYLPPYGTSLTPDDFVERFLADKSGFGWETKAYAKDGKKHLYGLRTKIIEANPKNPQTEVSALLDGIPVQIDHPHSKRTITEDVEEAQVYDWILRQDVLYKPDESSFPYEGNDIESVMKRAELGASVYTDEETCLENFENITEFQTWLDDNLPGITKKIKAFTVPHFLKSNWGYSTKIRSCRCGGEICIVRLIEQSAITELDEKLPLLSQHYHPNTTAARFHVPNEINLDENDLEVKPIPWDPYHRPSLSVWTDGPEIVGYCAGDSLSFQTYQQVVKTSADNRAAAVSEPWWGVQIAGSDLAIIFPRRNNNIKIHTDRDGAEFTIHIIPTTESEVINRVTDNYEREWGKWLDPDTTLTEAEVKNGIAIAEAMLKEQE